MTGISITAVILSHDRKTFICQAIQSLLRQDAKSTAFEIVVAKNYADEAVDHLLSENGIRSIRSDQPDGGSKLLDALDSSGGEVISLLDDDDIFEPGKIRKVQRVFDRNPKVNFLHNGVEVIDEGGNPTDPSGFRRSLAKRVSAVEPVFIPHDDKEKSLRLMTAYDPMFNCSSISIKKEVILNRRSYFDRAYCLDSLMFFSALLDRGTIALTPEPLTKYRLHPGNMMTAGSTRAERMGAIHRRAERILETYQTICKMAALSGTRQTRSLASSMVGIGSFWEVLVRPAPSRRSMLQALADHLTDVPSRHLGLNLQFILPSMAYLLSPGVASETFVRFAYPLNHRTSSR